MLGSYKLARRVFVGVLGATVVLLGIAMIVLPGPAFIVIPIGLAILGERRSHSRSSSVRSMGPPPLAAAREGREKLNGFIIDRGLKPCR